MGRAARWAAWGLFGLIGLLVVALAGVWIWAGSDGSLATALRWAGATQPLVTQDVGGNIRRSGKVGKLVWEQAGLRVEVHDAELQWSPTALLSRTLQIDRLSASRIVIDDQRAPTTAPSAGPPDSLALPVHIRVNELAASELRWAGPPAYSMQNVAGRFRYDGVHHLLELDRAQVEAGHYRARASVTARAPIQVDVALAGALTAPVPGAQAPLPLTLQATLGGVLTDMQARADLQASAAAPNTGAPALPPPLPERSAGTNNTAHQPPTPGSAPSSSASAELPEAHLTARITPWAAQPLPQAHARVRALDIGALWADAPRTALFGQLDVKPLSGAEKSEAGWALQADVQNRASGPWDQRQLPVDSVLADVTWVAGVAQVRALKASVAGGTVESTGRWAVTPAQPQAQAAAPNANGTWVIDTRIAGINPARLHTQLAAFPIDGTATVSGAGQAIDFNAALQARNQGVAPTARPGERAADALARDLRALRLRDAAAAGRWIDGLLTLEHLRVRTDDAELAGTAQVNTAKLGGRADLSLNAPGAQVAIRGNAQPTKGAGTVRATVQDAARALAWAQRLPGADKALAGARAKGRATLNGQWHGGWQDPTVQAELLAPSLDWWPPASSAHAEALALRDTSATLSGSLAKAQLRVNGRVHQGARQLDLRLAASGGRTTPRASLAASRWAGSVQELRAGVRDPALGDGVWQLLSHAPVALTWSPEQGGRLEAAAGGLTITSPAPASQARVEWGPIRWRAGELSSAGRLTGLPLHWIERVAGAQIRDAGVTGDVVFNGDWDATLGRTLRLAASLTRASGDLTVLTTDAQTGIQSRVPAGVRDARLTLTSDGTALNLRLLWDSTHAGQINGQLRTELSAARDAAGNTQWSWPDAAPLQGQIQARMPQISVWSVLAPPGWRLRGALASDTRIAGTRAAPLVTGTLNADDLALRSVVDGFEFAGGRLRARLDGTRLLVDEFVLQGAGGQAGGQLRATGEAGWIDKRMQARLSATLTRLRASIRADREVTVSGNVQAALDGRAVRADGRLRIDRALILLPEESAPSLGDDVIVRGPDDKIMYGKAAPGAVARPTSDAGQQAAAQDRRTDAAKASAQTKAASGEQQPLTVHADVQVDLGDQFRVQGMGVDTRLAGTLTLAANGALDAMPTLVGTVQTVGGRFRAYGQNLNITRGNIRFGGEISNPSLDIVALRPNYASDQRVGVQVMGTALLPRVRLYSEPALPDSQALAWLLLGRAAPSTGAEAAMLQTAALALLGGREGRGLAANFGLDELSFTGGGDGAVAGASVTLGKRLSDRLYAAYEHSLSGASGTLLIFYELSRRWTLRGRAGENAAVDLIYRLSFD